MLLYYKIFSLFPIAVSQTYILAEEDTSSIREIQESSGNRHIHFRESAQGGT